MASKLEYSVGLGAIELKGRSKVWVRTMVGIITGHCMIGRTAVVMGSDSSDFCRMC